MAVANVKGDEDEAWRFDPPLAASINPDALDSLFGTYPGDNPAADAGVWFVVDGHRVTVSPNGTIEISPPN